MLEPSLPACWPAWPAGTQLTSCQTGSLTLPGAGFLPSPSQGPVPAEGCSLTPKSHCEARTPEGYGATVLPIWQPVWGHAGRTLHPQASTSRRWPGRGGLGSGPLSGAECWGPVRGQLPLPPRLPRVPAWSAQLAGGTSRQGPDSAQKTRAGVVGQLFPPPPFAGTSVPSVHSQGSSAPGGSQAPCAARPHSILLDPRGLPRRRCQGPCTVASCAPPMRGTDPIRGTPGSNGPPAPTPGLRFPHS